MQPAQLHDVKLKQGRVHSLQHSIPAVHAELLEDAYLYLFLCPLNPCPLCRALCPSYHPLNQPRSALALALGLVPWLLHSQMAASLHALCPHKLMHHHLQLWPLMNPCQQNSASANAKFT